MINPIDLTQLKAFARQDGFWLGLVWIGAMWLSLHRPDSIWGPMMVLSTPFYIGWRLAEFRDYALEGQISFRRALAFSCYVFFYASLLFALGQYAYFRWFDNGVFMQQVNSALEIMKPYYEQNGMKTDDIELGQKVISMMTPLDLAFTFMMYNLMVGAFVSPFVALFGKKKSKKDKK